MTSPKNDPQTRANKSEKSDVPKKGLKPDDIIEPTDTSKDELSKDEDTAKFNEMLKKYHKISRDVRMSALIEEKKELEKMIKSPAFKYYEGSREDRLQALEEERELMEKLNDISKPKS